MEITLPNSQSNQSFRSVAGKRSSGRAVYLGDPRLALMSRSLVGAESLCSRRLAQSPQVLCFLSQSRKENRKLNQQAHDQFTVWFRGLSHKKKLAVINQERARIFVDRQAGNIEAAEDREKMLSVWTEIMT